MDPLGRKKLPGKFGGDLWENSFYAPQGKKKGVSGECRFNRLSIGALGQIGRFQRRHLLHRELDIERPGKLAKLLLFRHPDDR